MQKFTRLISLLLFLYLFCGIKAYAQKTDSISVKLADSIARYKADSTKIARGDKISGVIKDAATGKPVLGISVGVTEYSATFTDDKGHFTLNVPNLDAILFIKGQGYQQKEVPLKGRKTLPEIILFEDTYNSVYDEARLPLNNVSANRQSGAVKSVNTLGAWDPTSLETPDSYLQGKVAGLNVTRRSGTPNIGANLFLRGFNSLYGSNAPLLIVDGMIYDTYHYGNSIISGHINNPYGELDLHDVDNITVLKDASASIYGTKAANGVITISTNNNPDVATKIDVGIYSGYNYMPSSSFIPMMQGGDYRTYLSDVLRTSNQTSTQIAAQPYMNDNINSGSYYVYHNNTDWQKQAFKNGFNQNYNLRVSGGDNIARYVLAVSYGDNKGITRLTDLTKYSTRFNGILNISKHFTINTTLSFAYNSQTMFDQGLSPKTNPLYLSLTKAPFLRVHDVNAAGVESPNLADVDVFGVSNPEAIFTHAQESNQNYRFFGNFNFRYNFNKYFSAQTLIGITTDKVRENTFIPRAGVANDTLAIGQIADSRLGSQVQRLFNIYSDTHITYNRTFNRIHNLIMNLGTRYTHSNITYNTNIGYNSAIDQLVSVGTGNPALRVNGGDIGVYHWMNNYFSTNYTLYNKYIFNLNVTADASSRFGTAISGAPSIGGVKYAVLPSLSAAWLISSERFMSDVNFVELLKLRGSYGLTGNDDIGNYAARQYYVSQSLLGLQGLVRGNFGNPALQWEVGKKLNLGLDASFLQERLNITADAFWNKTDKMITQTPQSTTAGLLYAIANDGGMQTNGVELSITGRIINSGKLKWDLGLNIATYRNKITKLPNNSMVNQYAGANIITQVGSAANLFYGYKTNGVYTSNAEAASAGLSYKTSNGMLIPLQGGDMRFQDTNGDKVIDSKDMQVIGNPNPDYTGGISTMLSYKRLTLNALVTFTHGNSLYNYTRRQIESENGVSNQSLAILNRWRGDGQVTSIPRASYGDPSGNAGFSDRWIEDGSYLRLRTVTINYDVPFKIKTFKYIKIYATGNNLLTFTHYMGYDPEFSASDNVLMQGIDTTLEPQFRTVQLGIRVGI
ncbi:SusC/RagA family TonB-linked outer membrane protein [Mucilaginibacter boryungensis]|uniref:SusC/RagA family TonB-linked outer membrane protein n=1 Tax=Mucilaginibacter boryungensis TaxID=768480 RepID=A0ABR9XGP8_9SPHI|nr:SusC/RagA family TonB-linked outer membrane protein [Mucilaginibacter boryungensis]MBE9666375.1 SusC/RagA family TonB-linked outer membrane protein [Mucilaginibacter boryungensis]